MVFEVAAPPLASRNQYWKFHDSPALIDAADGSPEKGMGKFTWPVKPELWMKFERRKIPPLRQRLPCPPPSPVENPWVSEKMKYPSDRVGRFDASRVRELANRLWEPEAWMIPAAPLELATDEQ